jgi:hypothetical protein
VRPGWSSIDGGNDEFPEFLDAACSSFATRADRSAFTVSNCATRAVSAAMICPCATMSVSRAASSGPAVTGHHHLDIPAAINTTRCAGRRNIVSARSRRHKGAQSGISRSRDLNAYVPAAGNRSADRPLRSVPGWELAGTLSPLLSWRDDEGFSL